MKRERERVVEVQFSSVVEEATIIVVVETLKENFPHLIPLPQLILKNLNSMIKIKFFKIKLFFPLIRRQSIRVNYGHDKLFNAKCFLFNQNLTSLYSKFNYHLY